MRMSSDPAQLTLPNRVLCNTIRFAIISLTTRILSKTDIKPHRRQKRNAASKPLSPRVRIPSLLPG